MPGTHCFAPCVEIQKLVVVYHFTANHFWNAGSSLGPSCSQSNSRMATGFLLFVVMLSQPHFKHCSRSLDATGLSAVPPPPPHPFYPPYCYDFCPGDMLIRGSWVVVQALLPGQPLRIHSSDALAEDGGRTERGRGGRICSDLPPAGDQGAWRRRKPCG